MGRAAQAHTTSPSAEEIRQVFGEDYDWNLDAIPQDISAEIHQDPSHHKNDIELHGEDPEGIPENKPDAPWALAHMLKNCPRDPTSVEHVMGIVNGIMRGYGVEPLTDEHSYVSHYWQRTMALYVNTGDAYADTILYDCEGRNFLLGSWGSFYEDWQSTHEYRDPQEAED